MTNKERARYGRDAIRHGTPDYGMNGDDRDGLQTDIVDTMANLMHLAYREGLGYQGIVDSAIMHFEAEITGVGP